MYNTYTNIILLYFLPKSQFICIATIKKQGQIRSRIFSPEVLQTWQGMQADIIDNVLQFVFFLNYFSVLLLLINC